MMSKFETESRFAAELPDVFNEYSKPELIQKLRESMGENIKLKKKVSDLQKKIKKIENDK